MSDDQIKRLQRNLKFFANSDEEMEDLILRLQEETQIYRSVEPAGWHNLALKVDGELTPYHRLTNPFAEWTDQLEDADDHEILVCCGTGFGYQVPTLIAMAQTARKIVIVETRIEPLIIFLTELDLEKFFPENVKILYAPDALQLAKHLKEQFHRYHQTTMKFISLQIFKTTHPDYLNRVSEDIQFSWSQHIVFINSMEEQYDDILRNTLTNLNYLQETSQLQLGSAQGRKALILASGPSLDYNLPLIPAFHEYLEIIAVGSTLSPLLRAGIKPDLLIVSDPQFINTIHFPDPVYDVGLAYDPVIPASILKKFTADKLIFSMGHGIVELLSQQLELTLLQGWGTVTSSAIDLAAKAGFEEIILVGSDLSFREDSSHADNYILQTSVRNQIEALDVNNKKVMSTGIFRDYASYLDNQIENLIKDGISIINCCEGGILTSGKKMSLREYFHANRDNFKKKDKWEWRSKQSIARFKESNLKAFIDDQLQIADEMIDATVKREITMTSLMSVFAVAAFEGGLLDEAKLMEKALIDDDTTEVKKSSDMMKNAVREYFDMILESIHSAGFIETTQD